MRIPVQIENIEEMRHQEGIDDAELRDEVRGLGVGDFVRLTLLSGTGPPAGQTLLVRITRVRGSAFRGVLASRPAADGESQLHLGSAVTFTTAHIHSLPRGQKTRAHAAPLGEPLCCASPAAPALLSSPPSSSIGPEVEGTSMTTAKVKVPTRPAAPGAARPQASRPQPPPLTAQECLLRIEALGQRIAGYVEFMGTVGNLSGTSAEAKDRAIADFYEQMVVLEGTLGRIQENLRLG